MSVLSALRQELIDAATTAGNRIYRTSAVRGATMPYIVMQTISDIHESNANQADGLTTKRVQCTCVATTQDAADSLAASIRTAVHGMTAFTLGSGSNTQAVSFIKYQGPIDGFVEPSDAGPIVVFTSIVELLIGHTESVPTFS